MVGRLTLAILEWFYGLDRPYRPRVRWLGAVPVLQRGKERELVRFRVLARRRLSPSGRCEREGPKGLINHAADNGPGCALATRLCKEVHDKEVAGDAEKIPVR